MWIFFCLLCQLKHNNITEDSKITLMQMKSQAQKL